jgi:hypothetical protein
MKIETIEYPDVERIIVNYLEVHSDPTFASEIAFALGLDLGIAFETINNLLKEGRIKKAKVSPSHYKMLESIGK